MEDLVEDVAHQIQTSPLAERRVRSALLSLKPSMQMLLPRFDYAPKAKILVKAFLKLYVQYDVETGETEYSGPFVLFIKACLSNRLILPSWFKVDVDKRLQEAANCDRGILRWMTMSSMSMAV